MDEFTDTDITLLIQSVPGMNFIKAEACAKEILAAFKGKVLVKDLVSDYIEKAFEAIEEAGNERTNGS